MGVGFSYNTTGPVTAEIKTIIGREVREIQRQWTTTEELNFYPDAASDDRLEGDSKIFPDAIVEYNPGPGDISDARFIIDKLAEWSARFGLTWRIAAEGTTVGEVQDGKPDSQVLGMVETFEDPELWNFDL